jgi:DNA-binding XRE family transcriptional regulator
MNIMEVNNNFLTSVDDVMDTKFGKVGTPEREAFRREAYAYCMGQIIHDARKNEKVTQAELASRIGVGKSYISKIENGDVEPGVGTFYRIIDALGLRFEIVKPVY